MLDRAGSPSRPLHGLHPHSARAARRSAPTNNLPVTNNLPSQIRLAKHTQKPGLLSPLAPSGLHRIGEKQGLVTDARKGKNLTHLQRVCFSRILAAFKFRGTFLTERRQPFFGIVAEGIDRSG
jgi:hypothetical protein